MALLQIATGRILHLMARQAHSWTGPPKSARTKPIDGDSATCMEMYANGAPILIIRSIAGKKTQRIHACRRLIARIRKPSYAAGHIDSRRACADRRRAAQIFTGTRTRTLGFAFASFRNESNNTERKSDEKTDDHDNDARHGGWNVCPAGGRSRAGNPFRGLDGVPILIGVRAIPSMA